MKTYNNLWEKFISKENFEIALHDSQLGKKKQRQVITFNKNPEVNLEKIRQDVIDGRFHTSPYKTMIVFEPKKRVIYKLPYNPDRIVQHAVMNILRPIMEGLFIYDSYACVEGKGQMRASRRCSQFVRRNQYCLKCDVHHFYPSIRHDLLSAMLHKKIKDVRFMRIVDDIIFSFEGETNAPIGNYTSQWFGNFYLTALDYYVKQKLGVKDYLRYCDDFLLFSNNKAELHELGKLWNDREKTAKGWLVILSMVLVGLGAFIDGLTGVITEAQVTAIIGYVFSLILIIAGIVTSVIANKAVKKIE